MASLNPLGERLLRFVRSSGNRCFACGPANPHGLHLHFEPDGGIMRARFVPSEWQQGWDGVVHGGVLSAVLDETMAYVLFYAGHKAVTARLEIRFRKPCHAGEVLAAEGHLIRDLPRIADLKSVILRDGDVIAEATGRFVKLGPVGEPPGSLL